MGQGNHCILENVEGQTAIVRPFNDKHDQILNVQTVITAFPVDTLDGETYIIHLNQFHSSI